MHTQLKSWALWVVSLLFVSLGPPAFIPQIAPIAAVCGYALFWSLLIDEPTKKRRFLYGSGWFFMVQLIQLSWFLSHPYSYILSIYVFLAALMGVQFGVLSIFVTRKNLEGWKVLLLVPSLWVVFEWWRLFWFSGFALNPVGLVLSSIVPLRQLASIFGVYGLSFWVIGVNILVLKLWVDREKKKSCALLSVILCSSFIFGVWHLNRKPSDQPTHRVLLVQTGFPVEEAVYLDKMSDQVAFVRDKWNKIFSLLMPYAETKVDLIVFPEMVVPYGTYTFVYPVEMLSSLVGASNFNYPLTVQDSNGGMMGSNAFFAQAIADLMNASVVIGLEDAEDEGSERKYYSTALLFTPSKEGEAVQPKKYHKRKLVPMGEYIPFSFCEALCRQYGIFASFSSGKDPVDWTIGNTLVSPSICYDEFFSSVVRNGCEKSADLLVNLTNDGWFPHSALPRQHLEHAKLRAVENGVPLVRACNTGLTCAVDAHGNEIAMLGENDMHSQVIQGVLDVDLHVNTYSTIFAHYGDEPLILSCLFFALILLFI